MKFFKKGNFLYSIFNGKCPRCHEGDLWIKKHAYSSGFTKMPSECSHCGQKFDLEQGFWYGAMYISYGIGVVVSIAVVLLSAFFGDFHPVKKACFAMLVLVLISPWLFRFSRKIWINIFVRFDRKYLE